MQEQKNVDIAVKQEGGGGDDDVNDNVKKEDEGSVANELSSALSMMEGKNERSSCRQIRKGGRRC